MYYIDTMTLSVEALDFDDVTGTVSNRRILFGFEKNGIQGYPDGMTIDNRPSKFWHFFDRILGFLSQAQKS